MAQTERLYFNDSGLLDFTATVVDVRHGETGTLVALDRTAFYPTGGGQPHDTGTLGGMIVSDVIEDDAGTIFHVVADAGGLAPGEAVRGLVDAARRLDHMQQHSGQHILSQAFVQACGAETRSFHLGPQTSTIDIELDAPTEDHMRAAEEIANRVVFEDRPMHVHLVDESGARSLPLRKDAAVRGEIRVIEVEGFDWSPCGGTHAKRSGQIGLIAIRSFERFKKTMTRVEFVCGGRALAEYRRANQTAFAVARQFSAERDAAPELVARALEENKSLRKRQRELLDLAMTAEAAERLARAEEASGFKLVRAIFDDRDAEEIRVLAAKIVMREPAVALLATRQGGAARMVFARSASLDSNMGRLMNEACAMLGGRGGGKPDLAQGGGPSTKRLEDAMQAAAGQLLK